MAVLELSPRGIQMFPKPKSVLVPNTYAYESEPMVKATGLANTTPAGCSARKST
jgi:hypothetical protein